MNSKLTAKLRSLGYDCDNAISEGWALDIKEVKPR